MPKRVRYEIRDETRGLLHVFHAVEKPDDFDLRDMFVQSLIDSPLTEAVRRIESLHFFRHGKQPSRVFEDGPGSDPDLRIVARCDDRGVLEILDIEEKVEEPRPF